MSNTSALQVRTLGSFSLSYGGKTTGEAEGPRKKHWTLLAYLLAFRSREIPAEELMDLLYPGEPEGRAAAGVKTQIARAREALAELGLPDAGDAILVTRGSCVWNADTAVWVDADVFEVACQRAASVFLSPEERLELCLGALALYRGDYLSRARGEAWAAERAQYYHSLYVRLVENAGGLLSGQERWEDLIRVCGRAIQIDGFQERFYYYLIRGLIRTGQVKQALERYKRMYSIFYVELGVTPSEEMTRLYQEICQERDRNTAREGDDLAAVSRFLLREDQLAGAFFCSLEVFTDIYNLECRASARSGRGACLAMFTLAARDGSTPPLRMLNDYMEKLADCIRASLRRGDAAARYSAAQYLLLLPAPTCAAGQVALDRVAARFQALYPRCPLALDSSIREIDQLVD